MCVRLAHIDLRHPADDPDLSRQLPGRPAGPIVFQRLHGPHRSGYGLCMDWWANPQQRLDAHPRVSERFLRLRPLALDDRPLCSGLLRRRRRSASHPDPSVGFERCHPSSAGTSLRPRRPRVPERVNRLDAHGFRQPRHATHPRRILGKSTLRPRTERCGDRLADLDHPQCGPLDHEPGLGTPV